MNNIGIKQVLLVLLLCLGMSVHAQTDSRGRVVSTIIADGLAQLPAKNNDAFNKVIGEMAATGQSGMEMLVGMLEPSGEGKNAPFEYAIDGIVGYVSAQGQESLRAAVRDGIVAGLAKTTDKVNAAFLISELQRIPDRSLVSVLKHYLSDEYLREPVIGVLAQTPGIDADVVQLMKESAAPKEQLAYLAFQRRIPAELAEPVLLSWLNGVDDSVKAAIYNALSVCGSAKGLEVLHQAAKAVKFADDESGVTDAYLRALGRQCAGEMTSADVKSALKLGNELVKEGVGSVRIAGLDVLQKVATGKTQVSILRKALSDADREYRCKALANASGKMPEALATVSKVYPKLDDDAKVDVIRWFGDNHVEVQLPTVVAAMSSVNDELACAAIDAAGKIGGDNAVEALVAQLGAKHDKEIGKALLSCKGNVGEAAGKALDSSDKAVQKSALALVAVRKVYGAYPKVLALTKSDDSGVRAAAYDALASVAKADDFSQICDMLEKSSGTATEKLQAAARNTIHAESPEKQYSLIHDRMANAAQPQLYYPLLAQTGNADVVKLLRDAYENPQTSEAAYKALLTVNNPTVIDVLYGIAEKNATKKDDAIARGLALLGKSGFDKARQYDFISKALAHNPGTKVTNSLLSALAGTANRDGVALAERYLGNKATGLQAGYAIKDLVAKNMSLQTAAMKEPLMEARQALQGYKDDGNVDAGYAMDAIDEVLPKLMPEYVTKLDPAEKKQGFELLFDGKSLDNWHGNTVNYVADNGTIYVSASYGNNRNLYSNKKYSDFVYRFEFCFLEPGVNNGIGIRTREGVDAAYEGMEIQILDHDDPIYKGLRPYQQHGSVYGIIVPKHVKFGPVGTWNTEEIRAVGDHITVTVNGEVVLDGNIRTACQGHNVAPDGSKHNPYTVDHNNHPGLFNKSGNISFCGHGEGIRFRNIRILDLSKKTLRK